MRQERLINCIKIFLNKETYLERIVFCSLILFAMNERL